VKLDIGVPPLPRSPRFNRRRASRKADDVATGLLARQEANATATESAAVNSTATDAAKSGQGLDIGGLINGDLSSLKNVDVGGLVNTISGLFDGQGNVTDEISQGATQLLGSNAGDLVSSIGGLFSGSFDPSKLLDVGGDIASVVSDALGKDKRDLIGRQDANATATATASDGQLDIGGLLKGDFSSLGKVDIGSLLSTVTGLFDGQGDVTQEIAQEATKLLGSGAGNLVSTVGSVINGSADASSLLSAGGDVASLVSDVLTRSLFVRQDDNSTQSANSTSAATPDAQGKLDIGALLGGDLSSLKDVDIGSLISTVTGLFDGQGDVVDEASQAASQLLGADAGNIVQSVGDVISGGADASSLLNLGGDITSLVGGLFGGDANGSASATATPSASSTASADPAATSP
jgi:hypothetical protein